MRGSRVVMGASRQTILKTTPLLDRVFPLHRSIHYLASLQKNSGATYNAKWTFRKLLDLVPDLGERNVWHANSLAYRGFLEDVVNFRYLL